MTTPTHAHRHTHDGRTVHDHLHGHGPSDAAAGAGSASVDPAAWWVDVEHLHFAYPDGFEALKGVDLAMAQGEKAALVGPNGAGKSTFLKLAAGVEAPDRGRVLIDGRDLWKEEVASRRGLAYLPEQPDLTPYATIRDILRLAAGLRGEPRASVSEALEFFDLAAVAGRSVRELSLGQKRRATFAAAWIGRPPHLLLDEPLEAMDRGARDRILDRIAAHAAGGGTSVVVSHEIEPFAPLAERALALRPGAARLHDPLPEEPSARRVLLDRLARGEAV